MTAQPSQRTLLEDDSLSSLFSARRAPAPAPAPVSEGVLTVATDGACKGNPGPGGWCWYADDSAWAAGGFAQTTNNIAELTAVLKVLEATRGEKRELEIRADSQYVIDCMTKYIFGWRRNGWKTKDKKDIKNRELIEAIDQEMQGRAVRFVKVDAHVEANDPRGRVADPWNVEADARASAVARKAQAGVVTVHGPGWSR